MNKIKALIIDDEPKLQKVMEMKLQRYCPMVEVVGVAGDINEGFDLINTHQPNLVFLDIAMPQGSGFELLDRFKYINFEIIFATGFNDYVLDALRLSAVDYLLKPFSFDRFFKAVNKVIENQSGKEVKNHEDSFILIKSSKTLHKVNPSDILFIEALGDYVKVHLETSYLLTNNTFTSVLQASKAASSEK